MTQPRERCLKAESLFETCVALYFFKHQPPRAEGSSVWRKRRHPLRNEIGIDELLAVSVVR